MTPIQYQIAMSEGQCCACEYFVPVPFTVGRCGRKSMFNTVSITDERCNTNHMRCGFHGRYFASKRKAA